MILKKPLWVLLLGLTGVCWGNVNVYFSAGAPESTQATFLANTTNQCDYSYFSPNTFPNSYDLILSSCTFGAGVATTPEPDFVYGWADGATYNQYQQSVYVGGLMQPCLNMSTSTFRVWGSTFAFDTQISSQTCADVINNIANQIYLLYTSTPTLIPGGF